MTLRNRFALVLAILSLSVVAPVKAIDFLYAVDEAGNKIGKYNTDGTTVNANFIANSTPHAMAFDATNNILVTGFTSGYVAKYDHAGNLLNANYLDPGSIANPMGIGVDGSGSIFVINNGNNLISKYNADGSTVNAAYVDTKTGSDNPSPDGLLIQNNLVNVVKWATSNVGQYTTAGSSGSILNDNFLVAPSIPTWRPFNVATDTNGNYYVTGSSVVAKFDSSGNLVNDNFISFSGAYGIAIDSNNNIYLGSQSGSSIAKYSSTGALINASLISGFSGVTNIVLERNAVPEPSTYALAAIASGVLAHIARRRKRKA